MSDCLPTMLQLSTDTDGNRMWQQDPDINTNKIRYISRGEWEFWEDLIAKYLHPIDKDEAKQAKIEEELHTLRNQVCLFFFIVNGLFIVIIFTLQLINSQSQGKGLAIPLPCKSRTGVQLTIEPISLLFMIIFGFALSIQFFAMVFHRLGTLHHIIASTDINCLRLNQKEMASMDIQSKIQLVRELQGESRDDDDTKSVVSTATLDSIDEDSWADDVPRVKPRKTVMKIVHNKKINQDTSNDLGHKFVLNFMKLADDLRQTENDDEVSSSNEKSRRSVRRKSRKANPKGSLKLKKKQSLYALAKLKDDKEAVLTKAEFIGEKWKIAKQKQKENRQQTSSSESKDEAGGQVNDSFKVNSNIAMTTSQQQATSLKIINERDTLKRNKVTEKINAESASNPEKQNGGHEAIRCKTTILVTKPSLEDTTNSAEQSKSSTLESGSAQDGGDRRVTGSLLDESGLSDVSRTDSDIQLINHFFEGIDAPSSESNLSDDEEGLNLSENVSSQ